MKKLTAVKIKLWLRSLCVLFGALLTVFIIEHSYLIYTGVEELTGGRYVLILSLIGIEVLMVLAFFLLRKGIGQ